MERNSNEQYEHEIEKPIVRTSEIYIDAVKNLPHRFEYPHMMTGYGVQNCNSNGFYKTTNSDYGWYRPNQHTVPHKYFPKGQKFSNSLTRCGMYKNHTLNMI
ncbi:piercer of microtubule wall 1 protein [Condylostylus longicornis]|uniref:piercer of microtubule wall 1 protein n=1 Tax=Condylostylus longicornis TaxID=2530218 RepID=UPI00244DDE0A|nr:piercer of microtubule wall 1 protein [Condylostylus longicornis]